MPFRRHRTKPIWRNKIGQRKKSPQQSHSLTPAEAINSPQAKQQSASSQKLQFRPGRQDQDEQAGYPKVKIKVPYLHVGKKVYDNGEGIKPFQGDLEFS
ncbi:MAG: hypothetical protein NTX50_09345 [Candidatus Sumerlaeota bacterium]|nr:hypothetical protein [Candidatus Sumerlaeota bacterium]